MKARIWFEKRERPGQESAPRLHLRFVIARDGQLLHALIAQAPACSETTAETLEREWKSPKAGLAAHDLFDKTLTFQESHWYTRYGLDADPRFYLRSKSRACPAA